MFLSNIFSLMYVLRQMYLSKTLDNVMITMMEEKFSAYKAAQDFYSLFFNDGKKMQIFEYLENSFCDQIFEVNLDTGTFSLIYCVENKYIVSVNSGAYKELFKFVSDTMIYPDDKQIFMDLMNPETMREEFAKSEFPNFRFAHYRYKIQDGSYRWVELATLLGDGTDLPTNIVRVYLFDIHNAKQRELGLKNDEKSIIGHKGDKITGLLPSHVFYDDVMHMIASSKRKNWCAISIDIEHFKLFDEWNGRETGDYLLTKIGTILSAYTKDYGGVAGYFGQDDFAVLFPFDLETIEMIYDDIKAEISSYGFSAGFIPAFGICKISDSDGPIDAFDKASIAQYRAKQSVTNKINVYDKQISLEQEKEYHLFLDFMKALKNREITFYLQPQVRFVSQKIVGAEALARWITKEGQFISPVIFIPILEKFSFITDLDTYIWEEVCKWQRSIIDKGITPVPISVNVSRVDIFNINVAEHFKNLVAQYHLDPSLIKIEITESAYAEKADVVGKLVNDLRSMGFFVLMDDFGSGYSSLNMLRNLKVDAIKLDALFLNIGEEDHQKGLNILESVVNMAKTISLPIIVEGIENKPQVDFLVDLGCRYAQGFYYYKPMPAHDFEEIIKDKDMLDLRGIIAKNNGELRLREFLDENIYSDAMLNTILGPVAFYSWKDERVDIVRFNQKFYEAVGAEDFDQRIAHVEKSTYKADLSKFYELFIHAMANRGNGSADVIRFYRYDDKLVTFYMRLYYIGDKEGYHRFYGSVANITEQMDLQQKMSLLAQYSSDTIVFLKRVHNVTTFEVACHGLAEQTGVNKEDFAHELDVRTLHLRIPPKECEAFKKFTKEAYKTMSPFSYSFHYNRPNGRQILINCKGDPVADRADNVEYILTFRSVEEK